jgi:hypothetical protein
VNPHDCAARLNKLVVPELCLLGAQSAVYALHGRWLMLLLNLALLAWHARRDSRVDVTELFSALPREKVARLHRLAVYTAVFVFIIIRRAWHAAPHGKHRRAMARGALGADCPKHACAQQAGGGRCLSRRRRAAAPRPEPKRGLRAADLRAAMTADTTMSLCTRLWRQARAGAPSARRQGLLRVCVPRPLARCAARACCWKAARMWSPTGVNSAGEAAARAATSGKGIQAPAATSPSAWRTAAASQRASNAAPHTRQLASTHRNTNNGARLRSAAPDTLTSSASSRCAVAS